MQTWMLNPINDSVAQFVECYWYIEKEPGDDSEPNPKLYPDFAPTLILTTDKQQYAHQDLIQKTPGPHWIYPYLNTYTLDHSSPFKLLGIKFKAWALYALPIEYTKHDIGSVQDADINTLLKIKDTQFQELMSQAAHEPEIIRDVLDNLLNQWSNEYKPDNYSRLVKKVMPLLKDQAIKELGMTLHSSQRSLERAFSRVTHLSMKQCQTILRLEAILEHLFKQDLEAVNWAEVAMAFDFSDQPHMVRTIKQLIGKTPGEYARQQDLTIDVYGGFELE